MRHDQPDPTEATPCPATAERRRAERAASVRPLPRRIYRVDDFRPLDAWIVDVSRCGLALLLPEPQAKGTDLFIELESLPEAPPVRVWASVIRCVPGDNGDWLVGCELLNGLSDQELQALLV